jgi:hypothetical protein
MSDGTGTPIPGVQNYEQILGPLRAVVPLLTAVGVSWGLDDYTAGLASGAVLMTLAAVWSYFKNRPSQLAKTVVASGPDVIVQVGPKAPPDLRVAAEQQALGIVAVPKQQR